MTRCFPKTTPSGDVCLGVAEHPPKLPGNKSVEFQGTVSFQIAIDDTYSGAMVTLLVSERPYRGVKEPMRKIGRVLLLQLTILTLLGCSMFTNSFSDDIDRMLNPWLGKSKRDRILTIGPPKRCESLRTGEKVCSWSRMSLDLPAVRRLVPLHTPSEMHHVVFVYDQAGVAQSWHYSGSWGERSSGETGEGGDPKSDALLP